MIKNYLLILAFIAPLSLLSQESTKSVNRVKQEKFSDSKFNKYCLKEALYLVEVPAGKIKDVSISGDLQLINEPNASYADYGIELKENETQYFRLIGSEKLLAAKSLYSLRLNYNNTKK